MTKTKKQAKTETIVIALPLFFSLSFKNCSKITFTQSCALSRSLTIWNTKQVRKLPFLMFVFFYENVFHEGIFYYNSIWFIFFLCFTSRHISLSFHSLARVSQKVHTKKKNYCSTVCLCLLLCFTFACCLVLFWGVTCRVCV